MSVAGCLALLYLLMAMMIWRGNRSLLRLAKQTIPKTNWPCISIVVAGRNEERGVEAALRTLLSLDYPNLEVVFVNDRSEDQTGEIVERLIHENRLHEGKQSNRLTLKTIQNLPDGWLGKNHALWVGAMGSRALKENGYLLFTDADIHFHPQTLQLAVAYCQEHGVDHLSAIPFIIAPSLGLKAFSFGFGIYFSLYAKPWDVNKPESRSYMGVGAFNFIKGSVYEAIGTHQTLPLAIDDDMKLGKRVKQEGYTQHAVFAGDLIQVEWYRSIPEAVEGLTKNAFAGVNFSLLMVAWSLFFYVGFVFYPIWGFFAFEGPVQLAYGVALGCIWLMAFCHAQASRLALAYQLFGGLAYVYATVMFMIMVIRSTWVTLINQGVYWRGTFYPLEQLKKAVF
jgi:cellulose synthase/poly-beta-1,6-N-acetylglucosamine synthase-like glycosyltransferase